VPAPNRERGDDLERLLAWGRDRRLTRVLDVATGAGHTALAFAGLARRVVAFDRTEPMLVGARAFARSRDTANITFVAGDVEALPFPGAAFDLATCRLAPHHFPNAAAAIREMARVLTPGGSLLLEDILGHDDAECAAFVTEVERRRDPTHVRAYRSREWMAILRGAGLTIIDETVISKARPWAEWTSRTQMSAEARRALEDYVRAAPQRCRDAFQFRLTPDGVESFADRVILLRADKD
jgi:SAM-dependent methyltransferase